jgi:hypothetical protein
MSSSGSGIIHIKKNQAYTDPWKHTNVNTFIDSFVWKKTPQNRRIKVIGYILILENCLKTICRKKTHKNHLRSYNHEVRTAVVRWFSIVLDVKWFLEI